MIVSAKVIGSGISYLVYSAQAPGVGRGHLAFVMSRGELTNFASNPKRWLDGYREEESDTDATTFGKLVECLAGLSGKFDEFYAVAPAKYADEKTGKMKPWTFNANVCKAWREEQGEREVIKSELHEKAKLAVFALEADSAVSELFRCSIKQVMVVGMWKDKATGLEIPLRCLLDLVPDSAHPFLGKSLADFKTARNGCPDLWARVVDDSGYDVQGSMGLDLYVAATGEDRVDWLMPVAENVHPYHVVSPIPALTAEFLAFGCLKYQTALKEYAHCLATGRWPSYSTGNRLVIGPTQLIGPESVWRYREAGGAVASRIEYESEPRRQETDRPDVGH